MQLHLDQVGYLLPSRRFFGPLLLHRATLLTLLDSGVCLVHWVALLVEFHLVGLDHAVGKSLLEVSWTHEDGVLRRQISYHVIRTYSYRNVAKRRRFLSEPRLRLILELSVLGVLDVVLVQHILRFVGLVGSLWLLG